MRYGWICAGGVSAFALSMALASPPGPIDGQNIPSNFGAENLYATQTQYTGFGNYSVTYGGALIQGSEADGLYVAVGNGKLYVGITGNLETIGHAFMIAIDVPGRTGHTELRDEGVSGPPFTLQADGREVVVSDNGTPGDPTDDTWSYGAGGMILPCDTDYVVAVDTFGGTMYASEYTLFDPTSDAVGTTDPTPNNPGDALQDLYATRVYLGSTVTDDNNDVFEGDQGFGYGEAGFNNSNVLGVSDSDGSSAGTATTGMEIGIPYSRLGLSGTETIGLYIMLLDGSGDGTGTFVNQPLPPLGAGEPCDPPGTLGKRPDLTGVISCLSINLNTAAAFSGFTEGTIAGAEYGGAATATQTCPTAYGDQVFDPDGIVRTGGSELDALYLTSDESYLYVGVTGNLEENGNSTNVWIDVNGTDTGENVLDWGGISLGGPLDGGDGMEGDTFGPLEDLSTPATFDYALAINVGGPVGARNVYCDWWDLGANSKTYRGNSIMESGNGDLSDGDNPNVMQAALNNLNNDGVIGCGVFEDPCWFDSDDTVAGLAATAVSGLEIAIPLADLGLEPNGIPVDVSVWTNHCSNGGYRSNQTLPSIRGAGADSIQNQGSNETFWYDPGAPDPLNATASYAVTLTVTPDVGEVPCPGDANGDSTVDPLDAGFVLARFGCSVGTGDPLCDAADQNGDGFVDPLDAGFVLARFGACE